MNRFFSSIVLAAVALLIAPASAAPTASATPMRIQDTLGTFTCTVNGSHKHQIVFSPLFGGEAMQLSESDSRQLISYDKRRQKWIDQNAGSDGSYSVMEGDNVPHGIDFTAVYPSGYSATLKVRYTGRNTFTANYRGSMNGKTDVENESCVRA